MATTATSWLANDASVDGSIHIAAPILQRKWLYRIDLFSMIPNDNISFCERTVQHDLHRIHTANLIFCDTGQFLPV